MQTVIDPYYLFISDADWNNDHLKQLFLENFMDICDLPEKYPPTSFCWSIRLEEILWSSPHMPPWKYYLKNQLIAVYYRKFFSNQTHYEAPADLGSFTPAINLLPINDQVNEAYIELISSVVLNHDDFIFYFHSSRELNAFTININHIQYSPIVIKDNRSFFLNVPFIEYYWDHLRNDSSCFCNCLSLQREAMGVEDFLYEYTFSENFIRAIMIENNPRNRGRIIEQAAKRLTLSSQESGRDPTLQDEFINRTRCYRFRVTPRPSSCRIHYTIDDNKIHFTNYYGEGNHDDGL